MGWSSNIASRNIFEETQNTNLKDYVQPYIHCHVIYNSQDLEADKVPIGKWVDKKAVMHLQNQLLLSCKKEGNLTFCTSMDAPEQYYAKWNKLVREREMPYDFTYMWNLMDEIN